MRLREKLADDPALAEAVRLHMAGRLNDAILSYQHLMRERPEDADVLHLCGFAAHPAGASAAAVTLIAAAISFRGDDSEFHNHHAIALAGTEDHAAATQAFRKSIIFAA